MKNKLSFFVLIMAIGLFACNSEGSQTTEATTEEAAPAQDTAAAPAAAEDAINIEVPKEFLVNVNEKGEVKLMGEAIAPADFDKKVTEWFEGYRAMGAKTMPPIKIEIEGTVTMGVRNDLETRYNDIKTKFENLH